MWIKWNPNPVANRDEDCAVRAVAKALDVDWETAFSLISLNAFLMGSMMHRDSVWGSVLRQNGFYRSAIPDDYPMDYNVTDFSRDHPKGVFVLATGGHVVTVVDGNYFDTWDSGNEVPVYVWYRKDDS